HFLFYSHFFFFFQAEDVIRNFHVTGVQTCALPISFVNYMQSLYQPQNAVLVVAGRLSQGQKYNSKVKRYLEIIEEKFGGWKKNQIGRASCRERMYKLVFSDINIKEVIHYSKEKE